MPWDMWDLDHVDIPAALGGGGKLRPAHSSCNRRAGAELRKAIRTAGINQLREGIAQNSNAGEFIESETRNSEFDNESGPGFFAGDNRAAHISPGLDPSPAARNSPEFPGNSPALSELPGIAKSPADIRADHGCVTPRIDSVVWRNAPWIAHLAADMPESATWPRLMSRPHPRAVGSYGPEAEEWLEAEAGITLRWWQRLALARVLEHDAAGGLVWITVVLSVARQVGKSWLVRALALWRITHPEVFGEPQLVLHTGKDLNVCREVHRPGRVWARARGWYVRETNGQEEIAGPDESRWLVRGRDSVYGYPSSMALADEAWGMSARLVEDGLEPTMSERVSPQLVLLSTAHSRATSLMLGRRAVCLDEWDAPTDSLLLEWSAPYDAEIADRDAWRQASPHWTPGRARLLEARLRRTEAGISDPDDIDDDPVRSFRSQVLNVWPMQRMAGAGRDEALVNPDVWASLTDYTATAPHGPVTVAIEDWYGLGAAACVAAPLTDDRVLVWGDVFPTRGEALAWADAELHAHENRDGSSVIVGASLNPPAVAEALGVPVMGATNGHTRIGLPLIRAMTNGGQIVHGGDRVLSGQVTACRVTPRDGGLVITHKAVRSDLVRAVSWAVMSAARKPDKPVPFFIY